MALGKNMKIDRLVPLVKKEVVDDSLNKVELEINIDGDKEKEATSSNEVELSQNLNENSHIVNETHIGDIAIEQNITPTPSFIYENIETDSIKISFKPSRRKTQKRILIDIEGALTINNIELMHAQVHQVFDNYDFVEVTLKNITDIDLTPIQLFHAIRVSYYPQNKFIAINAELSSQDRKLLNSCGFTEFQTQTTANV